MGYALSMPLWFQTRRTVLPDVAPALVSRSVLERILGALWLADGLLQLQPALFTRYLSDGIMQPALQGQPGALRGALQPLIDLMAQHTASVNASIAAIELALGVSLLANRWTRVALLTSIPWALAIWAGGEGFGMMLNGGASVLTGAPGAALLYAVLALLLLLPAEVSPWRTRRVVSALWLLAAVFQAQLMWWQPHSIAGAIATNESTGTLQGALLNPLLQSMAAATEVVETALNAVVISLCLALAIGILCAPARYLRALLATSILLSALFWIATQGCAMLFTGTATDVGTSPLIVVLTVACWPSRPAWATRIPSAAVASGSSGAAWYEPRR